MFVTHAKTPVLIVEDEDLVAGTITKWLGGLGYEVSRATSAEHAMEQMQPVNPAVVVCDIGLPGHDGLWFAGRVRAEYPATAVVLATGRDDLPPAATMQNGVVSYLVKPFGRDQLRKAVGEAVCWHQDAAPPRRGPDLENELARRAVSLEHRLRTIDLRHDADGAVEALLPGDAERSREERVSEMALALASLCGLPAADQDDLRLAARLHRLWTLMLPESVYDGFEALSHRQLYAVRLAPSIASGVLACHYLPTTAVQVLRSLRERFDGMGVPDRLVGDRAPLGSRILAVAEAIEAMAHDRADRPARQPAGVVSELKRFAGTQFDPDVVRAAVRILTANGAA